MRWICGMLLLALLYLHVGSEYANHHTPYGGYQHYQQPAPPQQIHVVSPQQPLEDTRQTVRLQIEIVTPRNNNTNDDREFGIDDPPRTRRPPLRPRPRRPLRQPIEVFDQEIILELPPGVMLVPPQQQPLPLG